MDLSTEIADCVGAALGSIAAAIAPVLVPALGICAIVLQCECPGDGYNIAVLC